VSEVNAALAGKEPALGVPPSDNQWLKSLANGTRSWSPGPQRCVDYFDAQAATVAVGSTTTGAAGTSANVTNGGDATAAVLNFTIPKGDKGDKGDTGNAGPGVPAGGTAGQHLRKKSGSDYDTEWMASGIPAGGSTGQQLRKKTNADFDTEWFVPSDTTDWANIIGTLSPTSRPDLYSTFEPKNTNIQTHISNTSNPHLTTAGQVGAEPALGNPGSDLQCLQSYTSGTRTWGTCGSGGGSPGIPDQSFQYNNAGVFAGSNMKKTSTGVEITGQLVIK
jgi:hypothetical protein